MEDKEGEPDEELDEYEDDPRNRDKYELEPPPDHMRYTGGTRNAAADVSAKDRGRRPDDAEQAAEEDDEDKRSPDYGEPAFVDGQIAQGGKRLRYVDGHADYLGDVLNLTSPRDQFNPNFTKGETYSDSLWALRA